MAANLIAELTLSHPSRAILLRLADDGDEPSQQALVTAYCHRPVPGAQQVCSEFITLECRNTGAASIASLLFSLRLSGLPLVLVWDSTLAPDHTLLAALTDRLERAILAVVPPCAPASRLEDFFRIRESLGAETVTTDLAEGLLRPWQIAVARAFDRDPAAAPEIREIRLRYAASKVPAEKLLLAAWMSTALGWEQSRLGLLGSDPVVTFGENRRIIFDGRSRESDETVEITLASPEGPRAVMITEPRIDNRLSSLLLEELNIWGRDPLREHYLGRARKWLKEILFL